VDAASLGNSGAGDYVLDDITTVVIMIPTWRLGQTAGPVQTTIFLDDLSLSGAGPVGLAGAPRDNPRQPRIYFVNVPDTGDAEQWRAGGDVSLAAERQIVHAGAQSLRFEARFDQGGRGGGVASIEPTSPASANADRLDFWCYARDVPYLNVIIYDSQGAALVWELGPEQLVVGQWRHIELPFAGKVSFRRPAEAFGPVAIVHFAIGGEEPDSKLAGHERCVWYLDEVHLKGQGPARLNLAAVTPQTPNIGFQGNWLGKGDFTVTPEATVTHGHEKAIRLGGVIDPTLTNQAVATFVLSPEERKTAARFSFWCYPRDVPFLPIVIYDADNDCVSKILDERQLKVGQWNHVTIEFAGMPATGAGNGKMDAVTVIYFVPDPGYDPRRQYLKEKREYVWYLDDLELSGEGPVPLGAGGK